MSETGVVVPAYNAEATIRDVVDALCSIGFAKDHIIVVNDGSRDRTEDVVRTCGVVSLSHVHNVGKGAALKTGFDYARKHSFTGVITLDADKQHSVQDILVFLKHRNECDIVLGTRYDMRAMPWLRRLVNRTTSLVISILARSYVPDVQCGLRYIATRVLEHIELRTNRYQTESELVCKALRRGFPVGFVPVTTAYNKERSYINPFVDTVRFIFMAVRFLWQ
ncbi:glycosyltransferase family 2 protein [candidate division WOR-3 bacterium]|nr:glycosyltransferase family 2 protein [candidate division WOR-3 bacterium]